MGSNSSWFSTSIFSDGKMNKEVAIKSKAILTASTPRLAPRVPAPISKVLQSVLYFSYTNRLASTVMVKASCQLSPRKGLFYTEELMHPSMRKRTNISSLYQFFLPGFSITSVCLCVCMQTVS